MLKSRFNPSYKNMTDCKAWKPTKGMEPDFNFIHDHRQKGVKSYFRCGMVRQLETSESLLTLKVSDPFYWDAGFFVWPKNASKPSIKGKNSKLL